MGNNSQYILYQNRDDFKVAILETRNLRIFKIMNYGIRADLKNVHEDVDNNSNSGNRIYLLFGKSIIVVDNKNFNQIMRK